MQLLKKILRWFHKKEIPKEDFSYTLYLTELSDVGKDYPDNLIKSSRYTILTFLPLSFIEQFRKISNFYFIVMMVLYIFSPTTLSAAASVVPVIIVFGISMIKDAYDDIKRHRRDKEFNDRKCLTISISEAGLPIWKETHSKDLLVGDIIRVQNNSELPADIIPIYSSNNNACVNVTTANLDGETNVKKIFVVDTEFQALGKVPCPLQSNFQFDFDIRKSFIRLNYIAPNKDLTMFHGSIHNSDGRLISMSADNLLLRGTKIVKTDYILGIVAYTGSNTKLSLNLRLPERKYGVCERSINLNILLLIILLIFISFAIKMAEIYYFIPNISKYFYLEGFSYTNFAYVQRYFVTIILYAYLIPISIIISYEIAQLWTVFTISHDIDLYSEATDIQAMANSSSLADLLGQIEFLFSDKTGTLTQNVMMFRACSLTNDESSYFFSPENDAFIRMKADENKVTLENLDSFLGNKHRITQRNEDLHLFFLTVALCNVVEVEHSREDNAYQLSYQSSSPDEEALIKACQLYGIVYHGTRDQIDESQANNEQSFLNSKTRCITISDEPFPKTLGPIEELDESHCFIVDEIIEFNSDRKRMSIFVTFPNGKRYVISKGAESSMTKDSACSGSSEEEKSAIMQKVLDFSLLGLRTLVFSIKELDHVSYEEIITNIRKAKAHIGQDRNELLAKEYQIAENGMKLLGVTAVEDKLQEGIKDCLECLREAGIQIWVLTGDKEETAISVSQSAGHIPIQSSFMKIVNSNDIHSTLKIIETHMQSLEISSKNRKKNFVDVLYAKFKQKKKALFSLRAIFNKKSRKDLIRRKFKKFAGASGEPVALVIDGASLKYALLPVLQDKFLRLCMNSSAVLCCRVSPLQKAQVVRLVKDGIARLSESKEAPITASIGDGGNDVSMILEADVGIGIFGKEGMHAVRSSDYAIPQFSMLKKLLFVHGTWTYQRITYLMIYFYYKCTALVTPDFIYEFFNGFSDQTLYNSSHYSLYNVLTSLPIVIYAILDRFVCSADLLTYPRLFRVLTRDPNLRIGIVLLWILNGFSVGLICYFVTYLVYYGTNGASAIIVETSRVDNKAKELDIAMFGQTIYTYLWSTVLLKCLVMFHGLNWAIFVIFLVTYFGNVFVIMLYDAFGGYTQYTYVASLIFVTPSFWFGFILCSSLTLVIDLIWRLFIDYYWKVELKYAKQITKWSVSVHRKINDTFRKSMRFAKRMSLSKMTSVDVIENQIDSDSQNY